MLRLRAARVCNQKAPRRFPRASRIDPCCPSPRSSGRVVGVVGADFELSTIESILVAGTADELSSAKRIDKVRTGAVRAC